MEIVRIQIKLRRKEKGRNHLVQYFVLPLSLKKSNSNDVECMDGQFKLNQINSS